MGLDLTGPSGRLTRHRRQLPSRRRRQVGLRPDRQPALHPRLGARLPGRVHHARIRPPRATTCSSRRPRRTWPGCATCSGSPRHRRGRPVRADPSRLPPHPAPPRSTWTPSAAALGPEFFLLARAHFSYRAPLNRHAAPRILDVTGHPSVEDALSLASDALLTDYSSLMFDYAYLDRPIVVHAADDHGRRTRRPAAPTSTCGPARPARSPAPRTS